MKTFHQFIRAVFAAFMRVLRAIPASFLNLKGGGGAETRRTIACVCGGVFAVFFAMPFAAEEANAQTAAGHVFTAATGTFENTAVANTTVDISESVLSIIADARADYSDFSSTTEADRDNRFGSRWVLRDRGDIFGDIGADAGGTSNDGTSLIVFNNNQGEMQAGDLVRYNTFANGNYAFTIRLYNDENDVLFAAFEVRAADSATPANSDNGEFYLRTTDWTMTDTLSSVVFGYEAPTCNPGFFLPQDGDGLECEREPEIIVEEPENETPPPATDESDLSRYLIGGGLVLAMFAIATGDASDFAFSPDVGYSLTESGYSVNAGGRIDFAKDNWRLYWTAGQTNANGDFGDFRYSSGGEYKADIWTATFSESVQAKRRIMICRCRRIGRAAFGKYRPNLPRIPFTKKASLRQQTHFV